jgi:hypothetical protein
MHAPPRPTLPVTTVRHVAELLRRALTDAPSGLALRPLPEAAVDLLLELRAPARLGAHLRVVHDVACQLTGAVNRRWPAWAFDAEAVHFGAAIHDIGKVIHPAELSGPGSAHELAGWQLLIDRGLPPERARFARTHASWRLPEVEAEDLLVSLADKIWKGHRVKDLERTVLERIALLAEVPAWQAFLDLDDTLDRLADAAETRLGYQSSYPALT